MNEDFHYEYVVDDNDYNDNDYDEVFILKTVIKPQFVFPLRKTLFFSLLKAFKCMDLDGSSLNNYKNDKNEKSLLSKGYESFIIIKNYLKEQRIIDKTMEAFKKSKCM